MLGDRSHKMTISDKVDAMVARAKQIIQYYEDFGVPKDKILIKVIFI